MQKKQWYWVAGTLAVTLVIYFLAPTQAKQKAPANVAAAPTTPPTVNIVPTDTVILGAIKELKSTEQATARYLWEQTQNATGTNAIGLYKQAATFWGDTVHNHILGAYYLGKAAQLENSEKNLTFAARLLLDEVMQGAEPALQSWMANEAKGFFEKLVAQNPNNDSAVIAIGACYMFGNIAANPMEGILKVRSIAEKDPNNMYAQLMLGLGGLRSGQLDKAIERFLKVTEKQPSNIEATLLLADAYDRKGDKKNAVSWYRKASNLIQIPEAKKDIEERIKTLQQ
jgi:Flp pilus assembly protein TadD